MAPHTATTAWMGVSVVSEPSSDAAAGQQHTQSNSTNAPFATVDAAHSRTPLSAVELTSSHSINNNQQPSLGPDGTTLPRFTSSSSPTAAATGSGATAPWDNSARPGPADSTGTSSKQQQRWRQAKDRVSAFVVSNFMLLSFSLAAALAMAWPLPGKVVASWAVGDVRIVQAINNFLVFLISGLTLKSDDFRALLQHWVGVLYGLVAILAITPCFGFLMMLIPLQPREFAIGLALFCVVPTTLGVGVALTAASKGNQALALLLTVATNLLGIVTVPYELKLVLSSTVSGGAVVSVDPQNLVVKLLLTVLVPSVIGKLARDFLRPVERFVTKYKTQLSLFSTLNLAAIVWQTLSGARDTLLQQTFTSVLLVVVLSSGLHVVLLALNGVVVKYILRLPFREGTAVLIMTSQKSAPVAVTVISYLTPDLTQQGLMAIPSILGQLAQIFIGSALAKYLRNTQAAKRS